MKLNPCARETEPRYPSRSATSLRRIARFVAAVCLGLSSLGALPACGGAEPQAVVGGAAKEQGRAALRDRHLDWCQPTPRLSGDRSPANHFTCAPAASPNLPVHDGPPGITDGPLCQSGTSWARFNIPRPMRVNLTLIDDQMSLALYSPSGEQVARLRPGSQCLSLDMEPGVWVLGAAPSPGRPPTWTSFELFFTEAH